MTSKNKHKLRALLLASLMALSILAVNLGFVGGVAAQSSYGLKATDGGGDALTDAGKRSYLFGNFESQLPEGEVSGDDTLRVEATEDPLPSTITDGQLNLGEGDVVFDDSKGDVNITVIGSDGSEVTQASEGIGITNVSDKQVTFDANFDETNYFGQEEDPVAIEITGLEFTTGSAENVTLEWFIPNERAQYQLVVQDFNADLTATDENGGTQAAVTAGATNQSIAGIPDEFGNPARNFVLRANEDEFPSSFTTTVRLEEGAVEFHDGLDPDDVEVTSSGTSDQDIQVDEVGANRIEISVQNFDGIEEDAAILELSNVTFDAPPRADSASLTWEIRDENASYLVNPTRLDARFASDEYEFPRGLDEQPDSGVTLIVDSTNVGLDGYHDGAENLTVEIPSELQDAINFTGDASANYSTGGTLSIPQDLNVKVHENTIEVGGFPENVDSGDEVMISDIQFETSGYELADDTGPAFSSGLDVTYVPVNNFTTDDPRVDRTDVEVSSETQAIAASVPNVTIEGDEPTQLHVTQDGTAGTSGLAVNITDTTGHQIAPGTKVVIGLNSQADISFNMSQEGNLRVTGNNPDVYAAFGVSVSEKAITLHYNKNAEPTAEGDYIVLKHADGDGIRFDTGSTPGRANLTVQTNASNASVTQKTETAATVLADVKLEPNPDLVTVGLKEEVTVNVTDTYTGERLEGVTVEATNAENIDGETAVESNANGEAILGFTVTDVPDNDNEEIVFNAMDATEVGVDVERANISSDPKSIQAGETSTVMVTLEDARGDPIDGKTVVAFSDRLDSNVTKSTTSGKATLNLNPSEEGQNDITIGVKELDNVETSVEVEEATLNVDPNDLEITPDRTTDVNVSLVDADGKGIEKADVVATGEPLDGKAVAEDEGNGAYQFSDLKATEPGTITIEATDDAGEFTVQNTTDAVAAVSVEPKTIPSDESSEVTVNVTGAFDEPVEGTTVTTSGAPLGENPPSGETNETGEWNTALAPDQGGVVTIKASDLGVKTELEVSGLSITSETAALNATAEATSVTFTVTNESGDPVEDATVGIVDGPVANTGTSEKTDSSGQATLNIDPEDAGDIVVEAIHEGDTAAYTVNSVANIQVSPGEVPALSNETLQVTVTGVDDKPLEGVSLTTSGPIAESINNVTDSSGQATVPVETTATGTITVDADDLGSVAATVQSKADVVVNRTGLTVGQAKDVLVTVEGAGEPIENATVEVSGAVPSKLSNETDSDGNVTFTVKPDSKGDVVFSVHGIDATKTIRATEPGGGGTGNPGGSPPATGGGGGASPTTYADINVTDVSLSATEIRQGETVDVTVTLVNDGSADGTYDVLVRANTLRVASETVDVPKGETREVTVPVTFAHAGERKITVDGVEGGTVTIREIEPEDIPDGTTVADAQPVVDMDAEINGTVVEFDENVTVDAIVFGNASNGTVTVADLEALPADVPQTPGRLLRAMEIVVPAALENESATIRLSLDASEVEDREAVRLGRFHDGEWQTLQPTDVSESGGELVYEFETPGFSTFAVFAQETEDPQVTETPQGTDASSSTATDTDDGGTEEAGFGTFGMVAIAFIALIAVLLAAAGARMYQQNKP